MRVAYLVNQYPGISHTFVRREIAALERQGVAVSRFSIRPSRDAVIADEDRAEAARTRYIVGAPSAALARAAFASFGSAPLRCVSAFWTALAFGWRSEAGLLRHLIYFAEAAVLAAWLRDDGLRHIHAHFGTNSATVALLASKINAAGFSMTVHGPEEFDKPGLIALARKVKASRFSAAVSSYGASQLRRLVPPDFWDRIVIVRCGVERAFWEGGEASPPAPNRFVCVGRLAEQKGHYTLIEAAEILKAEGRDFKVALIGDGPMRAGLETAMAEKGVADRFDFLGWRRPAEVRAAIESARALVLPSYAEGLPVSIMEAFCLARPVVSTYIAGVPELVIPGENGWLAPAGDARTLAHAMAAALDASDETIARMGAAGRARVGEAHDIDRIAGELKALFEPFWEAR